MLDNGVENPANAFSNNICCQNNQEYHPANTICALMKVAIKNKMLKFIFLKQFLHGNNGRLQ